MPAVKTARRIGDAITALLLAAALLLSGILLSRQLLDSALYRQSKIIRSIFSGTGGSASITSVLTDGRSREVMLKFAGALANAYVSFELIPVNEAETFQVIHGSIGDDVQIDEFSYRRKNLVITGTAPDEAAYRAFLNRLRETAHFENIDGHCYTATDDTVKFEIECIAVE